MTLEAHDIQVISAGRVLVDGVSLTLDRPGLTGLLGPNGAGKSTLLRALYRVLKPSSGAVLVSGRNIWEQTPAEVARQLAVVAQERPLEHAFTVRDVVQLGRLPHQSTFTRTSVVDRTAVQGALVRLDLVDLAERKYETLSGGEKQRTLIARALAQEARLLLLDEPTNHLDVRYQLEVLEILRGLNVPVLVALHDLNLAALYCDELLLLKNGVPVVTGSPENVLTPETIRSVYDVQAEVQVHPVDKRPRVTFLRPGNNKTSAVEI